MYRVAFIVVLVSVVPMNVHAVQVDSDYSGQLTVRDVDNGFYQPGQQTRATQMAFGPGPDAAKSYVYISSNVNSIRRAEYDPVAGLTNFSTLSLGVKGNGIAFHTGSDGKTAMYLSEPYQSGNRPLSRLWKVIDEDNNGSFLDGGDTSVQIVQGIPRDDHGLNQIQIVGDSLHVGNGVRTRNGVVQTFRGDTHGETAYGGAILRIADLNAVANTTNSAGFYPAFPDESTYSDWIDGTASGSDAPFTSTADDKLIVFASGTRNPFGLAVDRQGDLWFTNNFQRTENHVYSRNSSEGDAFGGDGFADDIHDGFNKVIEFADYGYRNDNWQAQPSATGAGFFLTENLIPSVTFDNWITTAADGTVAATETDTENTSGGPVHDPSSPDGIGPHASVTGLDFFYDDASSYTDFDSLAFVTRWNTSVSDGGQNLVYRDIVTVDPATGETDRVLFDMDNPIDVLNDSAGNLLIAEYNGSILQVTPTMTPWLPGDFNLNDQVDAADLAIWESGYGSAADKTGGDADGDGLVTGQDFLIWQQQFGSVAVSASSAVVPEPTSVILALILVGLSIAERRR